VPPAAAVDLADAKRLVAELKAYAARALPYAIRNSLTTSAFEGRRQWIHEMESSFTLRNKWTTRSIRVVRARGFDVRRMEAVLGSLAPYMHTQEVGGTVRGKGRSKPIPTRTAAGQSMGSAPRTRVVRRPYRLSSIRLRGRRSGKTPRQRNAIAVKQAASTGQKFALLEAHGRKGLYRITGKRRLTVRLLWDLSRPSVLVPRTPTLGRTLDAIEPRLPQIHAAAIIEQLKRNRVLGYG